MFRLFLVVVLAVVVVQSQSRNDDIGKVYGPLRKLIKLARHVNMVPNKQLTMATCANEFFFVPTTQEVVDEAEACLADIESISDLVKKEMKKERSEFLENLNVAAEIPHNAFDLMELTAKTEGYLHMIFQLVKKNNIDKADQSMYINDCVLPVLQNIWENAADAAEGVKSCYGDE